MEISRAPSKHRFDIYADIHKALRAHMTATLLQVTQADPVDPEEVAAAVGAVRELADFCQGHLEHENEFLHSAIEAFRPGATAGVADDHRDHERSIVMLRSLADAVDHAAAGDRADILARLRRYLAVFIGESFVHMNREETENNAILWATHSDGELHALHGRIVQSLSPEENALVLRWMIPAVNAQERVALLAGMRAQAPAPVFEGALKIAQANLTARDWNKLCRALGTSERLAA